MADKTVNIQASTPVEKEKDFRQVHDIVVFHRSEVARKVNTEMLQMAWEIGQYISARIKSAGWGAKVVDELSEYLQQQEPGSRGFGRRNLYNMVTFYDKYSTPEFCEIAKSLTNSLFVQHKTQSEIVQMPSAQIENLEIMQMPSAQMEFAPLPSILTITTFSNHLEILNRTHSYQEAVFYMLYAAQQQLTTNELRRTIVTQTYGSIMSKEKQYTPAMLSQYPGASFLLKDRLILDFLNLPQNVTLLSMPKAIPCFQKSKTEISVSLNGIQPVRAKEKLFSRKVASTIPNTEDVTPSNAITARRPLPMKAGNMLPSNSSRLIKITNP
ncbi:MAG: hypothetical protein IJQ32_06055 [Paludibacteraceae bacterium]|nr:hypothetical protein [Paludibacteraceae bacterium]